MKEKDTINGEELERINSELFASFNPEDELWIVGGSTTFTWYATYMPDRADVGADFDYTF